MVVIAMYGSVMVNAFKMVDATVDANKKILKSSVVSGNVRYAVWDTDKV